MSAITIGGNLVHYEVLGRGRPVILLHSWVGSWRYWVPMMQQLQVKYKVYALDLYGFGDSGDNNGQLKLDHQVALVGDFMNKLGIQKAAFIGHGLGALVASRFAYLNRSAEIVPRLMLTGAPLFEAPDMDKRKPFDLAQPLTDNRPAAPEATIATGDPIRAMLLQELQASRARPGSESAALRPSIEKEAARLAHNPIQISIGKATPEALLAKCFKRSEVEFGKLEADVRKTRPRALEQSVDGFDSWRLLNEVRGLNVPTVIVHGSEDPLIPLPGDTVWNFIAADNKFIVPIEGIRHFPMLEYERFMRLALDFLEAPDVTRLEIKERWKRRSR